MRLRGRYLLLAFVASVGAVLVLAGPAAAVNIACGTDFTAAGTYHIYGNQSVSGTCYRIMHDGVTLIFSPGNSTITETANTSVIVDKGYDGFTVENAQVIGGKYQIVIKDSANSNVLDSTLSGGIYGVAMEGNTDTLVKGNSISPANGGIGIALAGYDTTDVITGNTIDGGNVSDDGIWLNESAGIVISGNTIENNGLYGIFSGIRSAGLAINGNVVDGNGIGMFFVENSGNEVANNYVQNSAGAGKAPGDGIEDSTGDLNSYTGNIVRENQGSGFYVLAEGFGPVILVNNASNTSQTGAGYVIDAAYNVSAYGGPFTQVVGNQAIANTAEGFVDFGHVGPWYSTNETWTGNSAWYNGGDGFEFDYPTHYAITGNSGSYNGGDGFVFGDNGSPFAPASFMNNAAMYNQDMGFSAEFPLAGSGNTGGATNVNGDCYLVAGCN